MSEKVPLNGPSFEDLTNQFPAAAIIIEVYREKQEYKDFLKSLKAYVRVKREYDETSAIPSSSTNEAYVVLDRNNKRYLRIVKMELKNAKLAVGDVEKIINSYSKKLDQLLLDALMNEDELE